jgi:hypothetical protein
MWSVTWDREGATPKLVVLHAGLGGAGAVKRLGSRLADAACKTVCEALCMADDELAAGTVVRLEPQWAPTAVLGR